MNTRIAVPFTKTDYETVSYLAKQEGKSRGQFVRDLVEAAMPSLNMIATAYLAADKMADQERAEYFAGVNRANDVLLQTYGTVFEKSIRAVYSDRSGSPQGDAEGTPAAHTGATGSDGSEPPLTNRGVHNLAGKA